MDSDLAKFREEKGISLHEISTKLNIPEKFLLAIEDLNFDELPAPIFAKSQIKKYCAFFDLEPLIILEKYVIQFLYLDYPALEKQFGFSIYTALPGRFLK